MTEHIAIKLFVNDDEVRRFTWTGSTFADLQSQCKNVAMIPEENDIQLKYEDNEKDFVSFSSDDELQYALGVAKSDGGILRLKMVRKGQEPEGVCVYGSFRGRMRGRGGRFHGGGYGRRHNFGGDGGGGSDDMDIDKDEKKIWKREMKHEMKQQRWLEKREKKAKALDARFVSHISIPDDTEVPVSTRFTKTWRMRNTGTAAWPEGTHLIRVDRANDLSTIDSVPVDIVPPNSEANMSIDMTTPPHAGLYASYFRLRTGDGKKFGQRIRCQILAVSGTRIAPEQIPKVWAQLEGMGFVQPGERPNDLFNIILEEKGDITRIVRHLLDQK